MDNQEDQLSLFHHNPPQDADLQRELFSDRKAELVIMASRIPGHLPCIRAIHGGSRVGKSHLALHFLQGLASEGRHHVFKVIAAGGHTARMILKDLYRQVRDAIQDVTLPRPLEPEGVGSDWLLEEAQHLIRVVDAVIPDNLPERPMEVAISHSFEGTDTFGFIKSVLNLTLASKETRGESSKFTLTPPDDYSSTWGEIGSFLSVCRKFYTWGWKRHIESEGQGPPPRLTVEDLHLYLKDELEDLLSDPNLSEYIANIRAATRDNQMEVTLDRRVLDTELVRWLLKDPATSVSPERFQIKPLAARVLREIEAPAKKLSS